LGIIGLLLVVIGIYGVTAYAVASRTREIGIRVALGATASDVLRMILKQGMSLFVVGGVAGLLLAAAASPLLGLFLLGMPSLDPAIYAGAAGFLAFLCLIASCIPATRAMRLDPIKALRED
jgi:ABC-type antimicrobial peptide transport system permease subunit